jgi:hypothetical protein
VPNFRANLPSPPIKNWRFPFFSAGRIAGGVPLFEQPIENGFGASQEMSAYRLTDRWLLADSRLDAAFEKLSIVRAAPFFSVVKSYEDEPYLMRHRHVRLQPPCAMRDEWIRS